MATAAAAPRAGAAGRACPRLERRCRAAAAAAAEHRAAIHETVLDGHHIEETGRRTERRRHPVRRSAYRRTRRHAVFVGRVSWQQLRAAVGSYAAGPGEFLHEGAREKHFAISSIEHVKEPVAVCLEQQLSRPALEHRVDEHRRLLRIPIPQIVRSELIVPAKLSALGVEREDRIRIEVVALPFAAIGIGIRISRGPEQRVGLGIVACRSTTSPRRLSRDRRSPSRFQQQARLSRARSRTATPARRCRRGTPRGIRECLRRRPRRLRSPDRQRRAAPSSRHRAARCSREARLPTATRHSRG